MGPSASRFKASPAGVVLRWFSSLWISSGSGVSSRPPRQAREEMMAKGQQRSNREKKKPKSDKNKKQKNAPAPSTFASVQARNVPGGNPDGKKTG
jgi:hypothetical protein